MKFWLDINEKQCHIIILSYILFKILNIQPILPTSIYIKIVERILGIKSSYNMMYMQGNTLVFILLLAEANLLKRKIIVKKELIEEIPNDIDFKKLFWFLNQDTTIDKLIKLAEIDLSYEKIKQFYSKLNYGEYVNYLRKIKLYQVNK